MPSTIVLDVDGVVAEAAGDLRGAADAVDGERVVAAAAPDRQLGGQRRADDREVVVAVRRSGARSRRRRRGGCRGARCPRARCRRSAAVRRHAAGGVVDADARCPRGSGTCRRSAAWSSGRRPACRPGCACRSGPGSRRPAPSAATRAHEQRGRRRDVPSSLWMTTVSPAVSNWSPPRIVRRLRIFETSRLRPASNPNGQRVDRDRRAAGPAWSAARASRCGSAAERVRRDLDPRVEQEARRSCRTAAGR